MTDINDSTTFDAQSVIMTKTNPTDAKFWPRAYASLMDGVILSIITVAFTFLINFLLDSYQYYIFKFFSLSHLNDKILQFSILLFTAVSGFILSFIIRLIYCCYYVSSAAQATPGMKLHGLKLVNVHGTRVSLGKVFLREIISIISFWGLFIGYLMILFTKRRQALHDMVTSTYVQDISQSSSAEILIAQQHQIYTHGGFWRRFGAVIIDMIICISIIFTSLPALLIIIVYYRGYYNDLENLVTNVFILTNSYFYKIMSLLFFPIFYWIFFTSSKFQATPGKMLFSLKIIDNDGHQLTVFKSFIRYFAYFYSIITLGIGFIMVAFTKRKQGLHDKITLTYVVHIPKETKDKIINSNELS